MLAMLQTAAFTFHTTSWKPVPLLWRRGTGRCDLVMRLALPKVRVVGVENRACPMADRLHLVRGRWAKNSRPSRLRPARRTMC